jgi:hypothetical protein
MAVNITFGQQKLNVETADVYESVNISLEETNQVSIPSGHEVSNLKSGATLNTFKVKFENVPENAKAAAYEALSIWEKQISTTVPINITIKWENLPDNQLGIGKAGLFYRNFTGAPLANVFYPVALVEKILSREFNKPDDADIICTFNQNKSWYFGTNGITPIDKYDFTTAVMHEVGHGLGISGFFTNVDGIAQYANSSNSPAIYDYIIFNQNNQRIADKTHFACPSVELTQQLTSNSLFLSKSASAGTVPVYAPSNWVTGVSIYHLKSADNTPILMKAFSYKGESIHKISEQLASVISSLGWNETKSVEINTAANNVLAKVPEISVYPNPCSTTLIFDCSKTENQLPVEIKISDLMGRVVYHESNCDVQFNPYRVDLSALKAGVYLASVSDTNNKTFTKRIIKQ